MKVEQRFGPGHRILVTGGAGFVPSHLVDRLIERGCTVVALDNFVTGSKENVAHLLDTPTFTLVEADVSDGLPDHPALAERFDAILHMASPASPTDFEKLPVEILRVGSVATLHLLERAAADGARFLLASTSEAYGDPKEHPQRETYWGNVNPIGVRSVYDEAKRFSEAATMAYRRSRGVDTAIVRIFNSILADEMVLFDDGHELRHEPVQALADRIGTSVPLDGYTVPAFDSNARVSASEATWLVGHPTTAPCFRITTEYGRGLAVTGDHSLFRRNSASGAIEPVPVRDLRIGDQVAIASRVEVVERDRKCASLLTVVEQSGAEPWSVAVSWAGLGQLLHERRREVVDLIAARRGASQRRSCWGSLARWRAAEDAPLAVIDALDIPVSSEATVRRYAAGAQARLPIQVDLTDDLLWLMGLYVAEGCLLDQRPRNAFLTISGDDETLDRAQAVIEANLGLRVVRARQTTQRGPALYVHSQLLIDLWRHLGLGTTEKSIPGWILGLPLSRLKWFMEGYRQGAGVHSGKKLAEGIRHEFSTVSTRLKDDLVVAFARFGLLPSIDYYASTMKKAGDRKHPSWRLTLCNVSPWSPLEWDLGVEQRITADRQGDLVWAGVTAIEPVQATPLVYDFCVPGKENFWAGSAVMAHNTYGPRMRPDDGRAIPTFISQALRGEPITVHGTGNQTRSICYVSDLVRGILLLLDSTESGPVNCGTEHEMSIRELAETIVSLCESKSEVTYVTRGADDPEMRRPDLTLARELLGYEPTVSPEVGLRHTIEHFRERS